MSLVMFRVLFDPFFLSFRVKQEWGEVGGGYMVEDREGKNCYSPENTKKKRKRNWTGPHISTTGSNRRKKGQEILSFLFTVVVVT